VIEREAGKSLRQPFLGPAYAWWHGIYDVAKNFYAAFLPAFKNARRSEAL
jgi:hypothetical protein